MPNIPVFCLGYSLRLLSDLREWIAFYFLFIFRLFVHLCLSSNAIKFAKYLFFVSRYAMVCFLVFRQAVMRVNLYIININKMRKKKPTETIKKKKEMGDKVNAVLSKYILLQRIRVWFSPSINSFQLIASTLTTIRHHIWFN